MNDLASLVVTRAAINDLLGGKFGEDIELYAFKSVNDDHVHFFSAVDYKEFKQRYQLSDVFRHFNFWGRTRLYDASVFGIRNRKNLLGNHGAVLDYMRSKEHLPTTQQKTAPTVYDAIWQDLYTRVFDGSMNNPLRHIFYGVNKKHYGTGSQRCFVRMPVTDKANLDILHHYFDEISETEHCCDNTDKHMKGLDDIADYIVQCMELELGADMQFFAHGKNTWQALMAATPSQTLKAVAVSAEQTASTDYIYPLLVKYLYTQRNQALTENGVLVSDIDIPILDDVTRASFLTHLNNGHTELAIIELMDACTIELPSLGEEFDLKTTDLRCNSVVFRKFIRTHLPDGVQKKVRCYLTTETAKEIVLTLEALLVKR